MSRIHRILSRAERDGTAPRLTWPPDRLGARRDPLPAIPTGWRSVGTATLERRDESAGDRTLQVDPTSDPTMLPARPVFGVRLNRLLIAAHEPFSAAAEQYRSLRTRIAQMEAAGSRRVMAVTSASRGDGRTVTAGNLALAMAQEFDRRVLIIDADLRHSRLHTLLGIAREPGLVDVLTGAVRLEEALVSLPGHRLIVLPAGAAHTQPAELLGSTQMRRLVELLRHQFDRVIIDTAVAQTSDTGALEALVDGVLLVVRASHTARPAIERALTAIPASRLMGLVLNDSRSPDGLSPA